MAVPEGDAVFITGAGWGDLPRFPYLGCLLAAAWFVRDSRDPRNGGGSAGSVLSYIATGANGVSWDASHMFGERLATGTPMSSIPNTDEPTEDPGEAPAAPHAGSPGVSGQGAQSALARLRQMEQQRDGEAHKPARDDD